MKLHDLTKSKQGPSVVVKCLDSRRKKVKFVQSLYNCFINQVLTLRFGTGTHTQICNSFSEVIQRIQTMFLI